MATFGKDARSFSWHTVYTTCRAKCVVNTFFYINCSISSLYTIERHLFTVKILSENQLHTQPLYVLPTFFKLFQRPIERY